MIEFSDDFEKLYSGKEAIKQRMLTRLKHTTHDIPYYDRGVDIEEFTYGNPVAAIKLGLRDFGADVSYDSENKRVQYFDVIIDASTLANQEGY